MVYLLRSCHFIFQYVFDIMYTGYQYLCVCLTDVGCGSSVSLKSELVTIVPEGRSFSRRVRLLVIGSVLCYTKVLLVVLRVVDIGLTVPFQYTIDPFRLPVRLQVKYR